MDRVQTHRRSPPAWSPYGAPVLPWDQSLRRSRDNEAGSAPTRHATCLLGFPRSSRYADHHHPPAGCLCDQSLDRRSGGRVIGDPGSDRKDIPPGGGDDRHIVTIAGSRAGKSRDVLAPNLLRYPGSVVVIDPKGELARHTATKRAGFGDVFVLDPFNIVPPEVAGFRASFNPLMELTQSS